MRTVVVSYGNTTVINNSNIIVLVKLWVQFKIPNLYQGNELAQHSYNLSKTREEFQQRDYLFSSYKNI